MQQMHRFIKAMRKYKLILKTVIPNSNDYFFEIIELELLRAIM